MFRPATNAQPRFPLNVSRRPRLAHVEPLEGRRLLSVAVMEPADARSRAYVAPASRPGADVSITGSVAVQASGISGTVFHDADADGTLDAGEAGVSGRRVWLDADNDRTFDAGETNVTTGADGRYAFAGLAAGTYNVRSLPGSGWNATSPTAFEGRVVTLADGQTAAGVNFGSIPTSSVARVAGTVFTDVNANGVWDQPAEPGWVPGRTVYLDADNDAALDPGERSFTTNVDGFWFENVLPGAYVLRLIPPAGMRQTSPVRGGAHVFEVAANTAPWFDFGVAPASNPANLPAVADAYVRGAADVATNYGAAPELVVKNTNSTSDPDRETYLRFDLTNVTTFSTARLRLSGATTTPTSTGMTIGVYPSADLTWSESAINWNNKPAASASWPLATATVSGTAARWYEWDVGEYVRQRKAAGDTAVTFVLRATQVGSAEAVFRSDESSPSTQRPRLALDAGPLVKDVTVSSTTWKTTFLTHLRTAGFTPGSANLGYGLPADTSTLVRLPWVNLDKVHVRFNEVVAVRAEDLQVGGVNGRVYPVASFNYNAQSFIATWTLARPLESDRVSIALSSAVTDRGSTPLAGGYFRGFNVEPGDASRDLRVNGNDILQIRARHGRTTSSPGTGSSAYSIFHDLTGDGVINVLDIAAARRSV